MLIWLGVVLFSILFNTICTFSWHDTAMSCSDNMCNTPHELCAGLALCCVLLWFDIGRLPGLIYWHWGNHTNCTIVSVPVKQQWRLWVNKSQELLKLMLCTQQSNKTLYKLMGHTIYHNEGSNQFIVTYIKQLVTNTVTHLNTHVTLIFKCIESVEKCHSICLHFGSIFTE